MMNVILLDLWVRIITLLEVIILDQKPYKEK